MSPFKKYTGNLLLLLLSSTLTIVVYGACFELFENVRYFRWKDGYTNYGFLNTLTVPSAVPDLLWEYRGDSEFRGVRTNRFGFRERDDLKQSPSPDTYRVAFAGDSVTAAWLLPREQGFVYQLEFMARAAGVPLEALDFGVDGYNASQVRALIEGKVLAFHPQRIVYVLCLNDFDYSDSSGEKIRYFRKPVSFLVERIERLRFLMSGKDAQEFFFQENKTRVFEEMTRMKERLAESGTAFSVLLVPAFTEESPGTSYRYRAMFTQIENFLRDAGIESLDGRKAFPDGNQTLREFALDLWHPSSDGHQRMATLLFPEVKRWLALRPAETVPNSRP